MFLIGKLRSIIDEAPGFTWMTLEVFYRNDHNYGGYIIFVMQKNTKNKIYKIHNHTGDLTRNFNIRRNTIFDKECADSNDEIGTQLFGLHLSCK